MGTSGGVTEEKAIEYYPSPVTIEKTKIIMEQMKEYICKIKTKNGKGTGFFCSIPFENDKKLKVLIANSLIIDKKILDENKSIKITLNDDKEEKTIDFNEKRKIYLNEEYNTTIIEIDPKKDKINFFLELDEDLFNDDSQMSKQSIYIIQYSKIGKEQKAAVSYGTIKVVNNYDIINYSTIESGSLGSPILNLSNNKVIGILRESSTQHSYNKGTFLKFPINEFIKDKNVIKIEEKKEKNEDNESDNENEDKDDNEKKESDKKEDDKSDKKDDKNQKDDKNKKEKKKDKKNEKDNKKEKENGKENEKEKETVKSQKEKNKKDKKEGKSKGKNEIHLKLKIDKNDINKEIYFIDNTDIFDENLVKHFHDYLAELDDSNVELYINDEKQKYQKFQTFTKEGTYSIKIKLKNKMKDSSYMFCNCDKLTNIEFSSFETKNITDMSRMFYNCSNLTSLDLSEFNTSNVTSMYSMFEQCYNLTEIDLSSFETENVTNMSKLFCGCKNLKKVNLSSFEETNITNFKKMFYGCKNLSEVKITKSFYEKIKKEMPSHNINFILL